MQSYKTKGIVLHTVKYGDSSLIAYLYTSVAGRQTYMIRGVRSSRGKGNKAALFQPMFLLEFEGFEPRLGEMHGMKDAAAAIPLLSLPFDVRKSTIALFMAETVYRLVRETEPDENLFGFIYSSVEALDIMEDGVSNFHLWFLVKLSYFLGFYPGNAYRDGNSFDIISGEFTINQPSHRMYFGPEDSALLGKLMDCRIDSLSDIPLSRTRRASFLNSLLIFINYHCESINSVRSIDILKEVF